MKILVLVSRYAPYAFGGAERVAQTLAASLREAGHEIVVLTTAIADPEPERIVDGIRVRSLPVRNVYDFSNPGPNRVQKALWHTLDSANPMMRTAVARVIREECPDLVQTHTITGFSPTAWQAAADCGVPVVHTVHDHYVVCAQSGMSIRDVPCERQHLACAILSWPRVRAAKSIAAVVGVSRSVLARHFELGALRDSPSFVIPNPVHLVGTEAAARPRPQSAPGQPLRLGFLGLLKPSKGIQLLLEATRELPRSGWTLAAAGMDDGDFSHELKREYADDRISFLGHVDPSTYLPGIDVLVVPSLAPETFGLSAAEAFAFGIPVVGSAIGAIPELIRDGYNGFLFDPHEPGALARILRRLIANPEVVRPMSDACRATAAPLAPALIAARYASLYESLRRG